MCTVKNFFLFLLHIIAAAIKPLSEGKLKIFGLESVKMKILVGSLPFFQAAPNKRAGFFLAVQDSSIGDLVTHSLINSLTF